MVHDNGQLVGMTKGPSRFCYLAQPGHHEIVATYADEPVALYDPDRCTSNGGVAVFKGKRIP